MAENQQFPIEVVIWHDASKGARKVFEYGAILLTTVGFLLYEDRDQVVLFTELECRQDYMGGESDYSQIPKKMILSRERVGTYEFRLGPATKPRKRRKADSSPNTPSGSTALPKPTGNTLSEES